MKSPIEMRQIIIKTSSELPDNYKIVHTIYGLEKLPYKRHKDKTWRYARDNRLSRLQMWNYAVKCLRSKNLKYLPKITKDRSGLNNNTYAYVYLNIGMNPNIYIKFFVNSKEINLRSLHTTKTHDNRFQLIKEAQH